MGGEFAADAGELHLHERGAGFDCVRDGKLFEFERRFVICQDGGTRRLQAILRGNEI